MENNIRAIGYKYGEGAKEISIATDFISLQDFIEGYLEVIVLDDNLCLIVNELGRLEGLPFDSLFNVYGNFLIAKVEDNKLISMDELSARRYLSDIPGIINKRKWLFIAVIITSSFVYSNIYIYIA